MEMKSNPSCHIEEQKEAILHSLYTLPLTGPFLSYNLCIGFFFSLKKELHLNENRLSLHICYYYKTKVQK